MKHLNINAYVESYGDNLYMGWVDGDAFRGVVVQGKSEAEVRDELMKSLNLHIAISLGLVQKRVNEHEPNECNVRNPISRSTETFNLQLS